MSPYPLPVSDTLHSPRRRFGIRMGGLEEPLEALLKQHSVMLPPDHSYTIVEIGSAGCTTLRAFRDIISEVRAPGAWCACGFDLKPGKAWSLDMGEVREAFGGEPVLLDGTTAVPFGMSLSLLDDPRAYLRDSFPFSIDFCLIDGSHGRSAGLDFEAIEAKVSPGGLVLFHDYGVAETGTDWQVVDREFISVRNYVHRLGLAHPCNVPRKGWNWVAEIPGSRVMPKEVAITDPRSWWSRVKDLVRNVPFSATISIGEPGDGNSMAVVQRTADPLEYNEELVVGDLRATLTVTLAEGLAPEVVPALAAPLGPTPAEVPIFGAPLPPPKPARRAKGKVRRKGKVKVGAR